MLDSLAGILATSLGAVAAVFAGLWARQKYRVMSERIERAKSDKAALDSAIARLDAARKTQPKPPDLVRRTDFEKLP